MAFKNENIKTKSTIWLIGYGKFYTFIPILKHRLALPVIKMMRNLLIVLTFSLFVSACNQENKLDGLWYPAYKQRENGNPEPLNEKLLLDIKGDSCYSITIGNQATGDLNEIIIKGHSYDRGNNTLYFDYRNFYAILKGDSLTLKPIGKIDSFEILNTIVLRKLNLKYKNTQCLNKSFKGSFVMSGENFTDSLDFINDSNLIHTGEWNLNLPANKWEIINYQDFNFFYIHDYVFPLTLLKFCSKDSIVLGYPFKKDYNLTLHPTKTVDISNKLVGEWNEINDSTLRPPPPQNLKEEDLFYRISINIRY